MPLATLFAAVMFCICHLLIKKMPDSKPVAIAQVIMWVRISFSNSCPRLQTSMINERTSGIGYSLSGHRCRVDP